MLRIRIQLDSYHLSDSETSILDPYLYLTYYWGKFGLLKWLGYFKLSSWTSLWNDLWQYENTTPAPTTVMYRYYIAELWTSYSGIRIRVWIRAVAKWPRSATLVLWAFLLAAILARMVSITQNKINVTATVSTVNYHTWIFTLFLVTNLPVWLITTIRL